MNLSTEQVFHKLTTEGNTKENRKLFNELRQSTYNRGFNKAMEDIHTRNFNVPEIKQAYVQA